MLILFIVAFAYFLNFEQGNNCFYGVVIPDSVLYLEDSRLVKIPKHVPAAFPLPSALKIPPVLFQTNERDEVPAAMYATIVSNIETNGDFDFRFFDRDDRREFMKQMGERYEKAYDALAPGAYKADLWRYTAVYKHGGCYMDAGSFTTKPFSEFLKATDEFVSSYDCKGHCLNSAFFCAVKGSKVLEYTLEIVLAAIQAQSYGHNALDITGPYKFIEGLRRYAKDPQLKVEPGDFGGGLRFFSRVITAPCLIATIELNGEVFVLSKYPGYVADMQWYTKSDKYGDMWNKRVVFHEQEDTRLRV